VDDEKNPWIVFCHEWLQINDGTICAMRLSEDLKNGAGDPILLFHGSAAPWVKAHQAGEYVTDGPFIQRASDRSLLMLWSSTGKDGYAMGIAKSANGKITGPWVHVDDPIYGKDGGHGMLFRSFEGRLMMTLHCPNNTPNERPVFMEIAEKAGSLSVLK